MTDMLIQEVYDDVRRDRMHALWLRVRKPLIAAIVLLIAITAGTSIYKHYTHQAKAEATAELLHGAELYARKDYKAAAPVFAKTATIATGEMRGIATLWQARSLLAAGNTAEAITVLNSLVGDTNIGNARTHDMACVHLYGVGADVPAGCTGAAASPMQATLALLNAATQWQAGKIEEATTALTALANDETLAEEERDLAKRYLTTIAASK